MFPQLSLKVFFNFDRDYVNRCVRGGGMGRGSFAWENEQMRQQVEAWTWDTKINFSLVAIRFLKKSFIIEYSQLFSSLF